MKPYRGRARRRGGPRPRGRRPVVANDRGLPDRGACRPCAASLHQRQILPEM